MCAGSAVPTIPRIARSSPFAARPPCGVPLLLLLAAVALPGCAALSRTTHLIDDNQRAVEASTAAIRRNQEAVGQSTAAIGGNAKVIAGSTESIDRNAEVIGRSTRAIQSNEASVRASTDAIRHNQQAISEVTAAMDRLSPAHHIFKWLVILIAAIVATAYAALLALVVATLTMRRSLRHIEQHLRTRNGWHPLHAPARPFHHSPS